MQDLRKYKITNDSETIIKVLTIFNPLQSLYNASSKASKGSIIITTNKGELSIPLNKITSILPTTPSIEKDNIIEQQETKQSNRKRNLRTL